MMKSPPAASTNHPVNTDVPQLADPAPRANSEGASGKQRPVLEKPTGPMIYTIEKGAGILPFWPRRKGS